MKCKRFSNIELLRIISMFMIIVSHYFTHNGIVNSEMPIGIARFLSEFLSLGTIGVALFMIISGYFLGESEKKLQVSKVAKLYLQIFFYSTIIYLLFVIIRHEPITMDNIVSNFTPVTSQIYWFATTYLLVYLFHPWINRFLRTLNRKEHASLIALLIVVFSLIKMTTGCDFDAGRAGLFLTYYVIGNYLRLYRNNIFSQRKICVSIAVISFVMIAISIIIFDILGGGFGAYSNRFISSNGSIFVIAIAVVIFCKFAYARPFSNKLVNIIASSTFGIYLIHDNPLIREVIWTDLFHNQNYLNSPMLIAHMIGVSLLVFIACGTIDLIRKHTLERLYIKKIAPRIDNIQESYVKKRRTE